MKLIIALLLLLLISAFAVTRSQDIIKGNFLPFTGQQVSTATLNDHKFSLTVAKEPKDIEVGLSKQTNLAQDAGMLFLFSASDYYPFWMRDMKFPLDIIFIKNDKVVTVFQDVQPPKSQNENIPVYKPSAPSNRVLEINAGLSKKYNIKEGDSVQFKNL